MNKNPSLVIMILLLMLSSGFISYQIIKQNSSNRERPKGPTQEEIEEQTIRKQLAENSNLGRIALITPIPSPCTDVTIYKALSDARLSPRGLGDVCSIDLSDQKLGKLPPEIAEFVNMSVVGLRGNNLNEFPQELLTLTRLTRIGLIQNNITSIPPDINKLTNLQVLNLNENNLSSLPEEFGELTNLEHLFLDDNNFSKLPESVYRLKKLTTLSLINNPLSESEKEKIQKSFPNTKVLFEL